MKIRIDHAKLGGAMLAAGPVLMQVANVKWGWWAGFVFTVVGPVLLSVRQKS